MSSDLANKQSRTMLAALIGLIAIALLVPSVQSIPAQSEGIEYCADATGLRTKEIKEIFYRNENCAIDCATKQGTMMSFFMKSGTKCGSRNDHECHLGVCKRPEERAMADLSDLYSVQIRVLSAHVPDLDMAPGTGSSDTFVMIEALNGEPSYPEESTTLCHTYVVQDNSDPKWRNFVCKPMPMKRDVQLRFEVLDSDKPSMVPDYIGSASARLGSLIKMGPTKLTLANRQRPADAGKYWIEVEVMGTKLDGDTDAEN